MSDPKLSRVLRKNMWAEAHRRTLSEAARPFLRSEPYRLRQAANPDGTEHVISVARVNAVPPDFALAIGDIAHNVRASLDHLAYSLVRSPSNETAFPIWHDECRDGTTGRVVYPGIAGGTNRTVRRLVAEAQPYFKGQDPDRHLFWMLRELDNVDKHRLVVTCAAAQDGSVHGFTPDPIGEWEMEPQWGKMQRNSPVAIFTFEQPNPNIKIEYRPLLAVSVEGVCPALEGADVIHFLWQAHRAVRDTAKKFESYLRR